ncbi:MAG TPA: PQQ-binding-like beta-propeller repeat protein [Steroidobacteraceae bacterium]|jgi:virginiamycin B lyase|nr:PQQ-binding-like beta-propeller repeat protein [Steroidobacteraceae bacterium]
MKTGITALAVILAALSPAQAARRPVSELTQLATLRLGKTADWVAIANNAVWVGATGPNAVVQIDPRNNSLGATVLLPGEPCAGLAVGFGSLWVPLCATPNELVRVDLRTHAITQFTHVGPADREGGVTVSTDSVWLILDRRGTLARIDPQSGRIRQKIRVPPGSYNPLYGDGQIFVTHADGAEVTAVDANSGAILANIPTGPKPHFLTTSPGAVWSLNQGDGTLTRIDSHTHDVRSTTALHTPGHGGDIKFGEGKIWSTLESVPLSIVNATSGELECQWSGPGGDSLDIGHGSLWLTNYEAGTISRYDLTTVLKACYGTL